MAFVQPDDDRVKNHGEKKNDREEQNHGLKGPQNQPDDDEQNDEPDNPPCTVITQRSVLIFVIGLFHNTRWSAERGQAMSIFAPAARNDKKACSASRVARAALQRNFAIMKALVTLAFFLAATAFAQTSQKHPFTFEDMMALKRVGAPVPSPDGKWVVFDCEDVDLEANTKISHLWIVPASGGESRRLNPTPNHEERPRFSPDGKRLIWTSKATDPTQIWMCDFEPENGQLVGKPHQVTSISTGADGGIWSPDGKNIVFVSAVYPDCGDDACNKQRDEEMKNSKVKAKIFTRLFYRHWNAFTEFKRSHLFAQSVGRDSVESTNSTAPQSVALPANEPRDLTPGDHDVPPFNLGGQDMYAISPDGQELAYTSNIDEVEATSTNNEIFIVPMAGGAPKKISTSPGSRFTRRSIRRTENTSPGDRKRAPASKPINGGSSCKIDNQGRLRDLTEKFDRSVGSFTSGRFSDVNNGGRSSLRRRIMVNAPILYALFGSRSAQPPETEAAR